MRLRLISRLSVLTLAVLVAAFAVVYTHVARGDAAPPLSGTSLGGTPAPAFALTDQAGQAVSLAAEHGHPVVLAFMYTHCPDECPLTAEKMHAAAATLGSQAANVEWIAISTDPSGDTPAAAQAFVATHHLQGRLHFLLGTQSQLAPIWNAYHVSVTTSEASTPTTSGVTHTTGLFLLDGQGHERAYLDQAFTSSALAADLRALLAQH